MRRPLLFAALAASTCVAVVGWRLSQSSSSESFSAPTITPPEAAPLCPWREPAADLQRFFPSATRYEARTRILSGLRSELAQRLGRVPTGDENALRLCQVYEDETWLGSILTRRVKGEYGAIEVVLAADTNSCVRGVRLQRLREPGSIADILEDTNWLGTFDGKHAQDRWRLGSDIPMVPAQARASAEAIIEGARSLLVSLVTAETAQAPALAATHQH